MATASSLQSIFDWRKNITCRYFLHGLCKEGDRCRYAHNRSQSVKNNVCRYYLQGKCHYGASCKFQHVVPTNNAPQKNISPAPLHVSTKGTSKESRLTTLRLNGHKTPIDNEAKQRQGSKYCMKDLLHAREFVPGQPFQGTLPPTYSATAKKNGESGALVVSPDPPRTGPRGILCPYAVKGTCRYGAKCLYMHGEVCDLCGEACLLPFDTDQKRNHRETCLEKHEKEMQEAFLYQQSKDTCLEKHEKEMQEAFLYQQSKDVVCGICMEIIMEKSPRERKFGILSDCTHPYCLDCIRKWRSGKQFEKTIIRGCPTCRKMSNFVTPSDYWVEDPDEKKKLIENYIAALSTKACKHFDQGRGKCPFGADCFYLHAYPDGTKEDRAKARQCRSSGNKVKTLRPALLWEFLEHRNGLYDFGSDEEDFFLFGSSLWHDEWDYLSEPSEAEDWLEYLQYMGSDDESENEFDSDWSGDIPTSGEGEETAEVLVVEGNQGDGQEADADDEWEEGEGEGREGEEEVEEEEEAEGDVVGVVEGGEGEIPVEDVVVGGVECIGVVAALGLVGECVYSEEDSQYSDCVDW